MRVLVIRFSSLGDVVLAGAIVRALGHGIPGCRITFATKAAYAPLFDHAESPVDLITLGDDQSLDDYVQQYRGLSYDWVIDLHDSFRSRRLLRAVKAARVARVRKHWLRRQLMVRFKWGLGKPLSTLDNYREAAARLPMTLPRESPRIFLDPGEEQQVAGARVSSPCCVGIGWGARWATKAVPPHLWTALIAHLDGGGVDEVRLFGLQSEWDAMSDFAAQARRKTSGIRITLSCDLSLREAIVRLASCAAFVSSDSGLMHVAAALEIPTIGLFGPTHPALGFAPVGRNVTAFHAGISCSPCHRHGKAPCYRERRYCFDELNVEEIAGVLKNYLTLEPVGGP